MAQLWKRSSANASDVCWGMGFGRYNGSEEYLIFVQHNGASTTQVYSVGPTGAQLAGFTSDSRWNGRHASDWICHQFGEYIYAANTTDGVWRKLIGTTTADSWGKVNTQQVSLSDASAAIKISWPTTQGYGITQQWGSGSFAGTVAMQISDSQAYPIATSSGYTTAVIVSSTNGQLYGKWTDDPASGSAGTIPTRFVSSVFTFTTAYNATDGRYWYLETVVKAITAGNEGEWSASDNGEPRFNMLVPLQCWASEDATAPANDFSDSKWRTVRIYATGLAEMPTTYADGAPYKIGVTIDLDHLQFGNSGTNYIDSIKKLAFRFGVIVDNDFTLAISSPIIGGTWMSKPRYWNYMDGADARSPQGWRGYLEQMEDLEYAVTDYNTSTLAESNATVYFVNRLDAVGKTSSELLLPLGSKVSISYSAPGGAYDSVRVWRKRHSDGKQWLLINQSASGSGAGSIEDTRVDAATDIKSWAELATRPETYDFGTADANTRPSAICAWRGHMVLGIGTHVYLSYQGNPRKYLAPVFDATNGGVDIDDPTVGRTLPMSYTLGDAILALHAPSELYAVGSEGVYAMVGDSANEASPFLRLPGAFGASGRRASCPYGDGIIVASDAGLFYYQIARATQDQQETRTTKVELTKDVREAYRLLLAKGAPNDVVVTMIEDDIVVARGRYMLRRDRDGRWSYHEYDSTALSTGSTAGGTFGSITNLPAIPARNTAVTRGAGKSSYSSFSFDVPTPSGTLGTGFAAFNYDTEHGAAAVSRSGVLMRLDRSAAGAEYTTDAGYSIPWAYVYGEMVHTDRVTIGRVDARVDTLSTSAGKIRVICEEWDGISGSRVTVGDKALTDSSFQIDGTNTRGGFSHTVTVCSESAAHNVMTLQLVANKVGSGHGN